jgi:hypothetical protein
MERARKPLPSCVDNSYVKSGRGPHAADDDPRSDRGPVAERAAVRPSGRERPNCAAIAHRLPDTCRGVNLTPPLAVLAKPDDFSAVSRLSDSVNPVTRPQLITIDRDGGGNGTSLAYTPNVLD